MSFLFSTEITSSKIKSDNALYQRTFKAYQIVSELISGDVLEIGCGEGYAIELIKSKVHSLTLIDKSKHSLANIKELHPDVKTINNKIPPLDQIDNDTFDFIISFQVIEHIKNYELYLQEIHRVLKPGGKAYISTPNKIHTIARNPWHYKEFSEDEMKTVAEKYFQEATIMGIDANENSKEYYAVNNKSVSNILKLDFLNVHKILPRWSLILPYEFFNRVNRIKLYNSNKKLVHTITSDDYSLNEYSKNSLDLFCILQK